MTKPFLRIEGTKSSPTMTTIAHASKPILLAYLGNHARQSSANHATRHIRRRRRLGDGRKTVGCWRAGTCCCGCHGLFSFSGEQTLLRCFPVNISQSHVVVFFCGVIFRDVMATRRALPRLEKCGHVPGFSESNRACGRQRCSIVWYRTNHKLSFNHPRARPCQV